MKWKGILKEFDNFSGEKTRKAILRALEEYPTNIEHLESLMGDVERLEMFVDDANYDSGKNMLDDVKKLNSLREDIVAEMTRFFKNPISDENLDGHEYRKMSD